MRSNKRRLHENVEREYYSDLDLTLDKMLDGRYDNSFDKSVYEDGYDEAYEIGQLEASRHSYSSIVELEDIEDGFEVAADIVDNWGADIELSYDREFIKEVMRGYNDGIHDYLDEKEEKSYKRIDNELYRRHHGRGIDENLNTNRRKYLHENLNNIRKRRRCCF